MPDTIRNIILNLQLYELISAGIFAILFFLRLLYLIFFTGKVILKRKNVNTASYPLSLIMTFRNDEENLEKNLPPLLETDQGEFEVIAVDDFSMDSSIIVLGALKEKYGRLKYSSLNQETWFSVKMAQNIAMKAAKYDCVMVIPSSLNEFSKHWPASVSSFFDEKTDVVVSYSNVSHDGKFYNLIYRTEFFMQQLKSAGYILNGLPYVVAEDNTAFKKDRYFLTGGYRTKIRESYANLELIINSFIKKKHTKVVFTADTAILRKEPISRLNFHDLLRKEIQIRKYLPFWRRLFLKMEEYAECLLLPFALIMFLFIPDLWVIPAALIIMLCFLKMFIIKKALSRLKESKLFLTSLMYGLFFPCYKLAYRFYYNHNRRRKKWKSKK
jgi:glycosyltransferase involved in cell wall biosynthesis